MADTNKSQPDLFVGIAVFYHGIFHARKNMDMVTLESVSSASMLSQQKAALRDAFDSVMNRKMEFCKEPAPSFDLSRITRNTALTRPSRSFCPVR